MSLVSYLCPGQVVSVVPSPQKISISCFVSGSLVSTVTRYKPFFSHVSRTQDLIGTGEKANANIIVGPIDTALTTCQSFGLDFSLPSNLFI